MKTIPLRPAKLGLFAMVSDTDYERIAAYRWTARRDGQTYYAITEHTFYGPTLMHRFILDAPEEKWVDHRDGNGLNNQRDNLRLASASQNGANRRTGRKTKGVSFNQASGQWKATITCQGKKYRLGWFYSENEAAAAYDRKARELFGEFALTNESLGVDTKHCAPRWVAVDWGRTTALVDAADFARVAARRWLDRSRRKTAGPSTLLEAELVVSMAEFIVDTDPRLKTSAVKWRNGNRYDNRRENLIVTLRRRRPWETPTDSIIYDRVGRVL